MSVNASMRRPSSVVFDDGAGVMTWLSGNCRPELQHYPNVRDKLKEAGVGSKTLAGTMHIGELAEKTGLSQRTIRHYDEVGLLKPSGRTDGGFRLYAPDDFRRLMLIRRMKPLGFSLEEMTDLLRVIDTLSANGSAGIVDPNVRRELASFVTEANTRRAKLQQQLAMADEFLTLLREQ